MSGLVFGAAEVVHYFTNVLGSLSGNATGLDLQDLTIQYIWRFLTDPIDHAMLGRHHRVLHRPGHHRPEPEVLGRPGRDRHRGRPARPQRLEPDQQPSRLGPDHADQRAAVPRLRPGRSLAAAAGAGIARRALGRPPPGRPGTCARARATRPLPGRVPAATGPGGLRSPAGRGPPRSARGMVAARARGPAPAPAQPREAWSAHARARGRARPRPRRRPRARRPRPPARRRRRSRHAATAAHRRCGPPWYSSRPAPGRGGSSSDRSVTG